jgi:hypothetical protein
VILYCVSCDEQYSAIRCGTCVNMPTGALMPISQDSNRLSGENSYEPPLTSMKSTSSFVAVAVAENMWPMYVDCSVLVKKR